MRALHTRVSPRLVAPVILLAASITTPTTGCREPAGDATYLIENASVFTADPDRPWAEAIAIEGDRILAVGTAEEVAAHAGPGTVRIDAAKGLLTPGFVDAHVHFLEGGYRLSSVQLRDAATPEAFGRRIRDFAVTVDPGTWITGGDWNHENWGGELPDRAWIDALTPENPVWVHRLDGHMALANTMALEAAGLPTGDDGAEVPVVDGGTLVADASGRLTGVLKDNAMSLVAAAMPEPPSELEDRALDAAMTHVSRFGVTSVHHVGSWDDLEVFRRAHDAGRLKTRIYAAVPLESWPRLDEHVAREGRGDEWLRIGGLKGFVDGSLGSHTAAFFEPFTDAPEDRGLLVNSHQDLKSWIEGADAAGLHVIVHAIGDRANADLLDLYEGAITANGPRERRFRIEHAQHLRSAELPRFAELGVIASMQPYHAIDDGSWAERVIGPERSRTTYAFRSLIDAGATLAFGSDWFVAPPIPAAGMYAAITRRTLAGAHPQGWVPEQKISLTESLIAYTRNGAYASFEEGIKGTLAPGMLADLVLFERDLRVLDPVELEDARVLLTMVGGRIVHDAR
ncbi:MAG TPA: amidohydrolase [Thermoanaerobaculia bacterium]|nr:amidohydrolase [Thermoanaerobaculia bacterium]